MVYWDKFHVEQKVLKTCIWWILLITYRSSHTQTDISIQFPQLSFQYELHLSRTFNFVAPYWQYGWFSGNVLVFSSLKIHINMFITKNIRIFCKVSEGLNHTNTETHTWVFVNAAVFAAYLHVRRIVGLLTTRVPTKLKPRSQIWTLIVHLSSFLVIETVFLVLSVAFDRTRSLNILLCVFRSVGVLAYVMLTGISPFLGEDKQETFLNISQLSVSYSDEELQQLDPAALSFIQMLLRKHPQSVTETTQFTLMWPQNVVSFLCISLIFGA